MQSTFSLARHKRRIDLGIALHLGLIAPGACDDDPQDRWKDPK